MSDAESTPPNDRRRPSYGLPGPAQPGPSASAPSFHSASAPSGTPGPAAADGWTPAVGPVTGPLPASAPGPSAPGAPRRRRGLWPLIIGLVLLVVVAPIATIGGLLWGVGAVVDDIGGQPIPIEASGTDVELGSGQMVMVYVPAADVATAECTAESATPGAISQAPSSGEVQLADGTVYEQRFGVVAVEETTATLSCTGTAGAVYLGPIGVFGVAVPMLVGPIIGVVAGLVGLVLTIVGIVLLVRSRRS